MTIETRLREEWESSLAGLTEKIVTNLALFAFAASSVVYLLSFNSSYQKLLFRKAALLWMVLASVLASSVLLVPGDQGQAIFTIVAAVGWMTVYTHVRYGTSHLGAFMAPLATLILLVHSFVGDGAIPSGQSTLEPGLFVYLHIGLSALGEAFAIFACATSLMYLRQQRILKKKMISQLRNDFPSLDRLTRLLLMSLWAGFILLTIGLVTGAVMNQFYAHEIRPQSWLKILWAIIVWVWYLVTLLARNVFNWPQRRIAQMSLGGFLLLTVAFFGLLPLGDG